MEKYAGVDNNTREDHLDEVRIIDECQDRVDITPVEGFSKLLGSPPRNWQKGTPIHRQMHRVQPPFRPKKSQHLFDPKVVSLGPYHQGKPELRQAEEFKYVCLDWCASGSEEKKCFFYNKVFEKIDEIRSCYAEASILEEYNNEALAMMMLRDACFIVYYMDSFTNKDKSNRNVWITCLGAASASKFTGQDIILLENQIPLQVVKLIISLHYEEGGGTCLIGMFLSWAMGGTRETRIRIPGEDNDPPLHLLEALWRLRTEEPHNEENQESTCSKFVSNFSWPRFLVRGKEKHKLAARRYTCLSATDLKAKGIRFRPSFSYSYKDIRFRPHLFHGEIIIPIRNVSENTQIMFSNLIAYELSPDTMARECIVLHYTTFMKSLIATPEDVKVLQENKVMSNMLSSHSKLVKLFEEIDTFGYVDFGSFNGIRDRIGEHCSSKAKTWLADLIHTRFESPWTVIALLAATFLLCLTFLQTYFTIHPANCICKRRNRIVAQRES